MKRTLLHGVKRQVFGAAVEEKATFHDLQTSTCESKMLQHRELLLHEALSKMYLFLWSRVSI
ncbi:MAG: hypothetical protein P4K94_04495 [Terracidiphilus sp.]|nr:hypothetical protein [Terracidiphilus sp.]